ncbi:MULTISPECIES: DUF1641 domain-containing protein [Cytobacillus]|uniref:DUF1641 domain-containing protein n=1 Tax=Cytobacillus stercorigallinarum TaxID=2762240 RepID=A0ABR8QLA5_9BACI|nr:DUF1641 domain-containing protein [Cytobacillus stercorigallinarum]MBD7936127.1 DUF1641 domain-containing protein [Cytobacillus stercorigallinarum]
MAAPITEIHRERNEALEQEQKLNELKSLLTENDQAVQSIMALIGELQQAGMLDAANSMLKGKEQIAKVALGQVTKEPVTNLINTLMGATGALMQADPEQTTKLIKSAVSGMDEGKNFLQEEKKIGIMQLAKVLNDPDINRAIGFGVHFLKGMGKELKEDK